MTALVLLAAFAAEPTEPPALDAESRRLIAAVEARVSKLEAQMKACRCNATLEVASAPATAPATADAPTYNYNPPANFKIENGAVVLDRQPTHISYPGGPYNVPLQQAAPVYQPQYFAQPMFGGGCANGQCSGGSRGFFGRRR